MSEPTINPLFGFHKLNDSGMKASKDIADEFHNLLGRLETIVAETSQFQSRSWSICQSKLEEACFYAKKSMATQERFQTAAVD